MSNSAVQDLGLAVGLTRKVFDPAEVNFTPGERSMVAWITTDHLDHERDVVVASGIDFTSVFLGRKAGEGNPVVLQYHDMGKWPLGQCEWVKLKRSPGFTGLYAKTVFDADPDAERVWQKVKARTVRGISIGFKPPDDLAPREWGPPTAEELRAHPNWAGAKRVIRRCVLLEYSVCSIGMNPHALIAVVNKGLHRPASDTHRETSMPTIRRFDVARKAADAMPEDADVTPADARVMIGLWLPPETAAGLAIPGGEPAAELHLTLCYLGRAIEVGTNAIERVKQMCRDVASSSPPLLGKIAGVGRFSASDTSDGKDVVYASADLPDLPECRQRLANVLEGNGVAYSKAHGFTPHITLAYVDPGADSPVARIPPTPVAFDRLCLVVDDAKTFYPFNTSAYGYGVPSMSWRSAANGETKALDDDNEDVETKDDMPDEETMAFKPGDHVKFQGGCGEVKSFADDTAEVDTHDAKCGKTGVMKSFGAADLTPHPGAKEKAMEKPADDEEPDADEAGGESDTEEDDESEDDLPIRRHDHVQVKAPHYKGMGRVMSVHKSGFVPDVDQDIMASRDEPAAKVKCYKAMGDGHVPTEHHVGVMMKHMTKVEALRAPSKKSLPAEPAAKGRSRAEPDGPPVVLSGGLTDSERFESALADFRKVATREGIAEIARAEAERAAGYI